MSLKATCAQTPSPVGAETRALASVHKLSQELLFSSGLSAPIFGLSAPRAFESWSQDGRSAEASSSHHPHPTLLMGTWMHREAGNTPSHTAGPRTGSTPLPDVSRCKPSYHSHLNLRPVEQTATGPQIFKVSPKPGATPGLCWGHPGHPEAQRLPRPHRQRRRCLLQPDTQIGQGMVLPSLTAAAPPNPESF